MECKTLKHIYLVSVYGKMIIMNSLRLGFCKTFRFLQWGEGKIRLEASAGKRGISGEILSNCGAKAGEIRMWDVTGDISGSGLTK